MADKKTPSLKSVSNGMTEREAMQRLIALRARQRAKGEVGTQMNVAAVASPRLETSVEKLMREHPGLTEAKIEEMMVALGG